LSRQGSPCCWSRWTTSSATRNLSASPSSCRKPRTNLRVPL